MRLSRTGFTTSQLSVRCDQRYQRHMSHTTDFSNNQIETAVAPPSKTAAALTLPSIAHFPVDALSWNDLCASAIAPGPAQQQSQVQVRSWSSPQGTELWPQACQSQLWLTPVWPPGAPPSTLPGTQSNNYLHSRRHQPGMPQRRDSLVGTAVDKMLRGLVGIRAEKATRAITRSPWKQRTVILFRSGTFRNQVLD